MKEWKTYNGQIVRPGMKLVCKNAVVFQGMQFDAQCRLTLTEQETYHECYADAHVDTPALSSAILEAVLLNVDTIGRYLESGDIVEQDKADSGS